MKKLSFLLLISITLNTIIYAQNTIPSISSNRSASSTKNYAQLGPEVPTIPKQNNGRWEKSNDGSQYYSGSTEINGNPYETLYKIDPNGQISITATSVNDKYTWNFFKNGNLKSVENSSFDGKTQNKWVWDAADLYDYSTNTLSGAFIQKANSGNTKFPSSYYPDTIKPLTSSTNFGPDNNDEVIPYDSKNDPLRDALITTFPEPKGGEQISKNEYYVENVTIEDPNNKKIVSKNFDVTFTFNDNHQITKIYAADNDPKVAQTYTWTFDSIGLLATYVKTYYYNGKQTDTVGHYHGDIYTNNSTYRLGDTLYERYPVGSDNQRNSNIYKYQLPEGYSQITNKDPLQKETKGENLLESTNKTDPKPIIIKKP